jgi:CRP-like cAMP-binding protein
MAILSDIQKEYEIHEDLFNKLIATVKYDHSKRSKNFHTFIEELPPKLRLEVSAIMHKKMYATINFFNGKDRSFHAWVGSVVRPVNVQEQDYIYKEGERIIEMYFLVKGKVGMVLPRYNNKVYLEIAQGDHFGHTDIFGIRSLNDTLIHNKKRNEMIRHFTAMAINEDCDLLTIQVTDLDKMRLEFPEVYESLFIDGCSRIKVDLKEKKKMVKQCVRELEQ